jgi:hypothetical protein
MQDFAIGQEQRFNSSSTVMQRYDLSFFRLRNRLTYELEIWAAGSGLDMRVTGAASRLIVRCHRVLERAVVA